MDDLRHALHTVGPRAGQELHENFRAYKDANRNSRLAVTRHKVVQIHERSSESPYFSTSMNSRRSLEALCFLTTERLLCLWRASTIEHCHEKALHSNLFP